MSKDEQINELLTRGVEEVIDKSHLEKRLRAGEKLRIKFGIDPTGSVLHLGHSVILLKLRELQELGHTVILLIGDFTARIGDPTGRVSARVPLSAEKIKENMESYTEQASKVLDMAKVEVRYNSEWLNKLGYGELIDLTSKVTFAQVARRADFRERIKNDIDLSLQEFMYPVMVGYDSVILKAGVEIGGTDQKFNLLMGRQLQERYNQEPQDIITCPLLEGLSGGDKMSKSLNNYIAITDEPADMYGKIMSVKDDLIIKYFILTTRVPLAVIGQYSEDLKTGANPRDVKMKLAYEITKMYHGEASAKKALEDFSNTFQKGGLPEDIIEIKLKAGELIVDSLIENKIVSSKNEWRRLIGENAVRTAEDEIISDPNFLPQKTTVLKIGKRRFAKIIKAD